MVQESGRSSAKSSWSKAPIASEPAENDGDPKRRARAFAGEVGAALRDGISGGADKVGAAMRSGLGSVERALEDPSDRFAAELDKQTDLPAIEGSDAIAEIGVRLDREADLWRGVAMRQLARAAWMDRLAVTSSVLTVLGMAFLASIAGFRALFAPEHAGRAAALLGIGAGLLGVATLLFGQAATRIRQAQLGVARDALLRADLAEARLHRVAALLELRGADREGYIAALRAFEADVRNA